MAKYVPGVVVGQLSGKQGNTVASFNRAGSYLRDKGPATNPQTASQQANRAAFGALSAVWKTLTDAQRQAWEDAAVELPVPGKLGVSAPLAGQPLYLRINRSRQLVGWATIAAPPVQFFAPLIVKAFAVDLDNAPTPAIVATATVLNGSGSSSVDKSSPGTFGTWANVARAGASAVNWSNPSFAQAVDSSRAQNNLTGVAGPFTGTTPWLQGTNPFYSVTPAVGSTVRGLEIIPTRRKSVNDGTHRDDALSPVFGGVIQTGVDKHAATAYTTSDANYTAGSSSDLWGHGSAVADFQGSGFGIALSTFDSITDEESSKPQVNAITAVLYWTETTPSPNPNAFVIYASPPVSPGKGFLRPSDYRKISAQPGNIFDLGSLNLTAAYEAIFGTGWRTMTGSRVFFALRPIDVGGYPSALTETNSLIHA